MAQARRDLLHAKKDVDDGFHEHACFESHQAAEKAVKAVYQRLHGEAWGHRVSHLLAEIRPRLEIPEELVDDAKLLDQYYIPTRYPNGFESGAPADYYTRAQAADASERATRIIDWCAGVLGT